MHQNKFLHWAVPILLLLAGCAGEKPESKPIVNTADAKALIEKSLPRNLADRAGWTTDIYARSRY